MSLTKEQIEFKKLVEQDGIEYATTRMSTVLSNIVIEKLKGFSDDSVKQFILEELDAARQGNKLSKQFVLNSGIPEHLYINSMKETNWGDDSNQLEQIQQIVRFLIFKIAYNQETMILISIGILAKMLDEYKEKLL